MYRFAFADDIKDEIDKSNCRFLYVDCLGFYHFGFLKRSFVFRWSDLFGYVFSILDKSTYFYVQSWEELEDFLKRFKNGEI